MPVSDYTNFPNGITSMGVPFPGGGGISTLGPAYIVNSSAPPINTGQPVYTTIQAAVDAVATAGIIGAVILIAPGSYDETVTISRNYALTGGFSGLQIIGAGTSGSVAIAPSTTDAGAVINDSDGVTFINVGMAANGTGTAFINTGNNAKLYGCKLENDDGTGLCAQMTLQTVAQRAAHTKGNGASCLLYACEFAWAASGVVITGTDQGAVTELSIVECWSHDMNTKHILESVGSGGSAGVTYNTLRISDCVFANAEDGTAPTNFIDLNAANTNTGVVTGCFFPVAINGGLVVLSTALLCVGCFFTGGISTAQPS